MSGPTYQDDLGRPCVPTFIDGSPVIQPSTASFPVQHAASDTIPHYGQTTSIDLAKKAVKSAEKAFQSYKRTTAVERRKLLHQLADVYKKRKEEARNRQMSETGADFPFADFNSSFMIDATLEAAAALDAAVTGEIKPGSDGVEVLVLREPVGPVLLIMPWNGALALPARGVASALAAGCTIILKASEFCPWTHCFFLQACLEAGFPPGTVNLVMADRTAGAELTEALISQPATAMVEFIGSANVGKAVGGVAARHLKPIIMELGDTTPVIVLDDANLEKAAAESVVSNNRHHGQVCMSTERIIVSSSIFNDFCQVLKKAIEVAGPAGSAVSATSVDRTETVIAEAVGRGATFLVGTGKKIGQASLSPTVLLNVPSDCELAKNEAFAPVMYVSPVDTDQQAIDEANAREGGLSASIYSANGERALAMAKELEFGMVAINGPPSLLPTPGPVTGRKASGWGSHGGRHGIELFLHYKAISIARTI